MSKFVYNNARLPQRSVHTRACTPTRAPAAVELGPANYPAGPAVVFLFCSLTPGHRGAWAVWPAETFLSGTVPFCLDRERPCVLVIILNTKSTQNGSVLGSL